MPLVSKLLINWPLLRGYFAIWDAFYWPWSLGRGGHCREVNKDKSECVDRLPLCRDSGQWRLDCI